jgi:hypothetical protein
MSLRPVYTRCDFLLLMDVNEWINYECSDEGTCTPNIHNSSTRSHASEGENRTRNRSKNCKCKQAIKCAVKLKMFELNL